LASLEVHQTPSQLIWIPFLRAMCWTESDLPCSPLDCITTSCAACLDWSIEKHRSSF